jgi:D-aminopeptidase
MPIPISARLDRLLRALPYDYPGPGGAVAVLRQGEVLVRHTWGFANAERRTPFTPKSLFRICSITKQFTCATALDAFPDLSVLDGDVKARLPRLQQAPPTALHLCHNQSGLRDYWAVAMLHGSPVEASFGEREAARVIGDTRTLQFTPGTRYAYANQNFRIISDIVQERVGRGFAELLRTRIFDRVGMEGALLAADTRALPDGSEGYEGAPAIGFRAAENRIQWTGDAGIAAGLDDMIAWEGHIDATRDDKDALYSRLSAPVSFSDNAPAAYGFGLSRGREFDRPVTGHGGALRGWRSHRFYSPSDRISVVVMFNHFSDARAAALELFAAVLGEAPPRVNPDTPDPDWLGVYVEPETGLVTRIEAAPKGQVSLRYGHHPELLDLNEDGAATGGVILRHGAEGLRMDRRDENLSSRLEPLPDATPLTVAGEYTCRELDANLTIVEAGGALYGGFSGFLGQGRMELLQSVAEGVWTLPCPRALDHTPPGDWTLRLQPQGALEVGCWLARRLLYERAA